MLPTNFSRLRKCTLTAAIFAGCLFAVPAFAQSAPSGADFAVQAAIGDIFEIETGKLVEEKTSPNASKLATSLAKDHAAMLADLKSLVQSGKVKAELPGSLDAALQQKFDKLKALKGGAFDKSYFDTQVSVQQDHVATFERYAKSGDNAELKGFAAKYLPRLQQHLKAVRDIREVIMDE